MVSMLASGAVYHGFKPQTMKLVFVASPLNTQFQGKKAKTAWLGIRIMCTNGTTYLSMDCCLSELVQ